MLFRLLLIFTIVPLVELALLLWVADHTTWLFTLALVVVTGLVGAFLARWQGFHTVARMRRDLDEGRMPTDSLLDGILLFVAGVVLVTPGILTDLLGLLLLIPLTRTLIKHSLYKQMRASFQGTDFAHFKEQARSNDAGDRIIEGKVLHTYSPGEQQDGHEQNDEQSGPDG